MIPTEQSTTSTHESNSIDGKSPTNGISPHHAIPPIAGVSGRKSPGSPTNRLVKLTLVPLIALGTAAAGWKYPQPFRDALAALTRPRTTESMARHVRFQPPAVSSDGIITLGEIAVEGMGLEWAKVVSQTEPIRLELLGTTEYDSDNQTRIRPLFKGRVDRVYAKVGQLVTKGEPLIEFYSTDLAEAKNACEIE
jgi:membrane fusion protein, heavy metal efflux system